MHLLNAREIKIETFINEQRRPEYAILSHTWGDDEITYQELQAAKGTLANRRGFLKIENACRQTLKDGLHYVWIDTCCINKMDSAELSEAINSMFRWYHESVVCYAYLDDVHHNTNKFEPESPFGASRWFTRGWTLQELIAPNKLDFFTSDWVFMKSRAELSLYISEITNIDESYLLGRKQGSLQDLLRKASIAQKMSWVARRSTTRGEDIAYCLLGIFQINMTLLYGEGKTEAFRRLQEEIIRRSFEPSIFAWNLKNEEEQGKHKALTQRQEEITRRFYEPSIFERIFNKNEEEGCNYKDAVTFPLWWSAFRMVCGLEHPWYHNVCQPSNQRWGSSLLADEPSRFKDSGDIVSGPTDGVWSLTEQGLRVTLPISANRLPYLLIPCFKRYEPSRILAIPLAKLGLSSMELFARPLLPALWVRSTTWHLWRRKCIVLMTSVNGRAVPASRVTAYELQIKHFPPEFHLLEVLSTGYSRPGQCFKIKKLCFNLPEGDRATNDFVVLRVQDRITSVIFDIVVASGKHTVIKKSRLREALGRYSTPGIAIWVIQSDPDSKIKETADIAVTLPLRAYTCFNLTNFKVDIRVNKSYLVPSSNLDLSEAKVDTFDMDIYRLASSVQDKRMALIRITKSLFPLVPYAPLFYIFTRLLEDVTYRTTEILCYSNYILSTISRSDEQILFPWERLSDTMIYAAMIYTFFPAVYYIVPSFPHNLRPFICALAFFSGHIPRVPIAVLSLFFVHASVRFLFVSDGQHLGNLTTMSALIVAFNPPAEPELTQLLCGLSNRILRWFLVHLSVNSQEYQQSLVFNILVLTLMIGFGHPLWVLLLLLLVDYDLFHLLFIVSAINMVFVNSGSGPPQCSCS